MRIAVSTDSGNVSAHFGRCPEFTIADIESGKVLKKEVINNPGHAPGNIPHFLHGKNVECIVAGGMGQRAQMFFDEFKIKTIIGISGRVDDVLEKLAQGSLQSGPSSCNPGDGKGYGIEKQECDHPQDKHGKNC